MTDKGQRTVAVLGSTGSVGVNALQVCDALPGHKVVALSGRSNLELLSEQALRHPEAVVVAADANIAKEFEFPAGLGRRVRYGSEQLEKIASEPETDIVLAAIVGSAGLPSTVAAVAAGKTVALANKESLVVAGSILIPLAEKSGAKLLPVDSEHSAVFQCLMAGRISEIERIVLTASGGPFRDWSELEMDQASPAQATRHPTWNMGSKISVDSATMMNKALEIVEAAWLFGLEADQIAVMVHPQSLVHALLEFCDGTVMAHLGPPDMKLPIQYALCWPDRIAGPAKRFDWANSTQFDLIPPDPVRFPALELGYEVVRRGGTSGAVLNAANEVAVSAFLDGRLRFTGIVPSCRAILSKHKTIEHPTLQDLLEAERLARQETEKWILDN